MSSKNINLVYNKSLNKIEVNSMSLAKVIEVIAEGKTMEEAVENAVKEASETVHNIKSVYVENITGVVEGKKISKFRVNAKVTFVLEKQ